MTNDLQDTYITPNSPFAFENIGADRCLFLGEGNMSFSTAIATKNLSRTKQITATTYERFAQLGIETKKAARFLAASFA